jgi:cytoskeletal protein RodZ
MGKVATARKGSNPMTTDELKEWMQERFNSTDEKIDFLVASIKNRCEQEQAEMQSLKKDVKNHDRQLWILRGVWIVVVVILGIFGIKIRI